MAKRRKKSSKCPEPLNTMIDLAAAAAFGYIANKWRKKRTGDGRGRIDPYTAAGVAMGLGMLDDTEDMLKLGGILGAMGAFDTEEGESVSTSKHRSGNAHHDNRYAWRLNCEDGTAYGIDPHAYETRDEYNDALRCAKGETVNASRHVHYAPKQEEAANEDCHTVLICRVSLLKSGQNLRYLADDETIHVGDRVTVSSPDGIMEEGIVISIERDNDLHGSLGRIIRTTET